ncbi:MAG: hypothetical protein AAGM22_19840, partial [Acidobacteriota bacterium]
MSTAHDLQPPQWLVSTLQCTKCRHSLEVAADRLRCAACGAAFAVDRGVVNVLDEAHPAVESERKAVAALDAGEVTLPVPPGDADAEAAFHRHVTQSRRQLEDVLDQFPIPRGALVVELGADSCWASPLFLDRGCRVLAVDITDHLHLAEAADHLGLGRVQCD